MASKLLLKMLDETVHCFLTQLTVQLVQSKAGQRSVVSVFSRQVKLKCGDRDATQGENVS